MAEARLISGMSKDEYTKVGAVLVKSKTQFVKGYNGTPRRMPDEVVDRAEKNNRTIHAEVNAILMAPFDTAGTVMFVTHHPCDQCAIILIQSGVREVYWHDFPTHGEWEERCSRAADYMRKSGVWSEKC